MKRTLFLLSFLAFLALAHAAGHAGTFDMSASVDRDHLELGESLHLSINVSMNGQMAFGPQLEQPNFDGFAPQGGPQQSQQVQWVNGAVSMTQTITWELVAQKSGTLSLGPFHAQGKDALNGTIVKTAPAIRITVTRPKNLAFHLPSSQPTPEGGQAPPAGPPDDAQLRDIKGDRPLPWALIGLVTGGLLALSGLLFWWWFKPKVVKVEEVPRDPAQVALEQLEKAYQALQPGGEAAFIKAAEGLLRQFLRHKLRLRAGVTLSEALREVRFQAPGALKEAREALAESLTWLLYSGVTPQPADADQVYAQTRAQVIELERIIVPPAPEPVAPAALAAARARPARRGRKAK